jgi:hypothetical protein
LTLVHLHSGVTWLRHQPLLQPLSWSLLPVVQTMSLHRFWRFQQHYSPTAPAQVTPLRHF